MEVIVGAEAVKWLKLQPPETQAAVLALLAYVRRCTYAEMSEPRAKLLMRPTADQRYDDFLRRRRAEGTQP